MKQINLVCIRILTVLLLLCMIVPAVSAAPLAEPVSTSELVSIPEESADAQRMPKINMGLTHMYKEFYDTGYSLDFPYYFAGFYTGSDGFLVMCLTEITDDVLAEIRTAFYSYRSNRSTEEEDIQYMDKWFPTISYQLVEYSYEQLSDLRGALQEEFKSTDRNNYTVKVDVESNQVILFCDNKGVLESAAAITNEHTSMLQVLPLTQFETWANERSVSSSTQTNETAEPAATTSGIVRPGMQNAFYESDGTMSSGTVGFTAFLEYNGSTNTDLGLSRGDTVEAVFTHGHDISNLYPYSSIHGLYSADLLYCKTTVDYSFYMPRNGVTISGRRLGSTTYFTEYCEHENDINYYLDSSDFSNVYFYGDISGEETFAKSKLNIDAGMVNWVDSNAISQKGDSGGPIYFSYEDDGGEGYVLIAIISTSNVYSGGEGQTIYSIINDIELHSSFSFDSLCTE